jgi:hypothetical protein
MDVKSWVEKVIDSCITYPQTIVASKLINNFYEQMKNNNVDIITRSKIESELKYRLLLIQHELITN